MGKGNGGGIGKANMKNKGERKKRLLKENAKKSSKKEK